MEGSRKVVVLLIVLVLILVCALIYTVSRLNKVCGVPFVVPEGIENTTVAEKTETEKVETEKVITNDDVATLQMRIGESFEKYISRDENVTEVRVNRMSFVDGKEMARILEEDYDPNLFYVDISYDVKVKNVQLGLAGNGREDEDNWIVEKSACTTVKLENGEYTIVSEGTGW